MDYVRLCVGLNDIGRLVPSIDPIYKHIKDLNRDVYKSVYYYTETQREEFYSDAVVNGKRRLKGCAGITDVYTNKLFFDFDSDNLEYSKQTTLDFIKRLLEHKIDINRIQIYFSGKKGFNVVLNTLHSFNPEEHKLIAMELTKDLAEFDSTIYNSNRIIRIPYSKHQETGLYKIPMSYNELKGLSIDEIKKLASEQCEPIFPEDWDRPLELPEKILELKNKAERVKEVIETFNKDIKLDLDLSKNKLNLSSWKYALLCGYFPNGTRSHALMILASTFKNLGMDNEACYGLLKGVCRKQNELFGGERVTKDYLYKNVINEVYSSLWKNGCYAEENFPEVLKKYLRELGLPEKKKEDNGLITTDDMFNDFDDFATNIDKNTILTGIEPLDKLAKLRTSTMVGILGAPSSGKSSIALEILKNTSLKGEHSIFFSLDMGSPLVYTKLAQKVSGFTDARLYQIFKEKDSKAIANIRKRINDDYKNMTISFKTALTVESIKESIVDYEQSTGHKVRVVVVDYLECLSLPTNDDNLGISIIAQRLKDIANDLKVCVVLLLQPPKRVGDPSKPITSYCDIKGASSIAQAASVVLTLYREGFDPRNIDNDKFISFFVVKNRMGTLGSVDCSWEGLTGTIGELDDREKEELEELRKSKAQLEKISGL